MMELTIGTFKGKLYAPSAGWKDLGCVAQVSIDMKSVQKEVNEKYGVNLPTNAVIQVMSSRRFPGSLCLSYSKSCHDFYQGYIVKFLENDIMQSIKPYLVKVGV